ncbi:MAG: hypothetical protein IJD92_02500 [Bacilli bacterium]|nr:hypothetical protein [Bacilli bacterium]
MKKTFSLIITLIITLVVLFNIDPISTCLADFMSNEKKVSLASSNDYTKKYDYLYVQNSNTYIPYSYKGLINIIYSTLNNGWETFTFYCPNEYTNCINDIAKISKDSTLLSNINNYVHPFNNFSKINIASSTTGEITIKVTKLYSDEDINKINIGVDEIITEQITTDMSTEDKILKIHDYIINNTRYDVNKVNDDSYTALGPLFNGTSVCSGYADLMAIFLTKFGLNNYKVASDTHVWNAVYINDEWLNIDLTWDDPITKNSDVDTLLHQFFLVNTETLLNFDTNNHNFDTTIYQELN